MRSRSIWGAAALVCIAVAVVAVPIALGSSNRATEPGSVSNGKLIFVAFCGKCHTFAAAGAKGTLGPNLDSDKVSYTRVVTAVEEGVGGIQAEYVLRAVRFSEVYDVAKFVVTDRSGAAIGRYNAGSP